MDSVIEFEHAAIKDFGLESYAAASGMGFPDKALLVVPMTSFNRPVKS